MVGLHTDQGIEGMVINFPVISSRIGPCKFQYMLHILGNTGISITACRTELVYRVEVAVFIGTVVSTEYSTNFQVLDGLQFGISVAGEEDVFVLIMAHHH